MWAGNVFTRLYSWVTDAADGIPITASRMDADTNDIANSLAVSMQYVTLTTNGAILPGIGTVFVNIASAAAITLPSIKYGANTVKVIDSSGLAETNNITVTPANGTINGEANYVINKDYGSATFVFDGSNWEVSSQIVDHDVFDRQNVDTADPTGTTSLTPVMMGTGADFLLSPTKTGNYTVSYGGVIKNTTSPDGVLVGLHYGTGAPPINGAAAVGILIGSVASYSAFNDQEIPFTIVRYLSGLSVGTTYWIDISISAITGGTGSISRISLSAVEI